ncbi:hypothetical protein HDU96_005933 [Phlyctochytrium bullatum]|nr:hypothetical protein HDU96_005933 [Phlyctochytrium bullatum]
MGQHPQNTQSKEIERRAKAEERVKRAIQGDLQQQLEVLSIAIKVLDDIDITTREKKKCWSGCELLSDYCDKQEFVPHKVYRIHEHKRDEVYNHASWRRNEQKLHRRLSHQALLTSAPTATTKPSTPLPACTPAASLPSCTDSAPKSSSLPRPKVKQVPEWLTLPRGGAKSPAPDTAPENTLTPPLRPQSRRKSMPANFAPSSALASAANDSGVADADDTRRTGLGGTIGTFLASLTASPKRDSTGTASRAESTPAPADPKPVRSRRSSFPLAPGALFRKPLERKDSESMHFISNPLYEP